MLMIGSRDAVLAGSLHVLSTAPLLSSLSCSIRKRRLLVLCGFFSAFYPVFQNKSIIMSWDSYIDNLVAQTKDASGTAHCDKACIIGLDGGGKWTTDGHANAFKLEPTEAVNIAKCFKNKDFSAFMAGGIHAEGIKYQFLREEDGKLVLGKKKDHGAITLQSSKTAIVIGHCTEGCQQGNVNKGVGVIAEYLESLNM